MARTGPTGAGATAWRYRGLVALPLLAMVAAGCGADAGDAGRDPGDTGDSGALVATFEVAGGERFKVEMATPQLADHSRRLLQGEQISTIPLGFVVRGDSAVNGPWTWHLDPSRFEFAFATIEVCDGIPSDVEKALVTSDMYCPWSAKVVAVDPVG
jgi:hypothetical protein